MTDKKLDFNAVASLDFYVRAATENLPGRARVAGGAVRDLLLGRPVKDVDLFVEADEPLSESQIVALEQALGVVLDRTLRSQESKEYNDPSRTEVPIAIYPGTGKNGMDVDVIVTRDIEAYIEDFPDDISMVSYDGLYVDVTPRFLQAHQDERITYRDSAGGERLQRLLAKYDYTVKHVGNE